MRGSFAAARMTYFRFLDMARYGLGWIGGFCSRLADVVPGVHKWRFWLLLALAVKLMYFWIVVHQPRSHWPVEGSFGILHTEGPSYIDPIENLVIEGDYSPDFRMPGYGVLYLPLRLVLPRPMALDALVLLQTLLDALAVYALALGAFLLVRSRAAFLLVFLLYGMGSTVSCFNAYVMTEGVTASMLCFAFHFSMRYVRTGTYSALVLASGLLTWAYFIRPITIVLVGLMGLYVVHQVIVRRRGTWRHLIVYLVPIMLIQGAWTIRNAYHHGRIFLLTKETYLGMFNKTTVAAWQFVGTFDDNLADYGFESGASLFPEADRNKPQTKTGFPSWVFTNTVTPDSLDELRRLCPLLLSDTVPASERERLDLELAARFDRYARSIRAEHPWMAYAVTPTKRAMRQIQRTTGVLMLFTTPFDELGLFHKLVKVFGVLLYKLALFGALLFIPWSVWRWRLGLWPVALAVAYGLFIHSVVLGFGNERYLYPFFPLMCLGAGLFYAALWARFAGMSSPGPERS